ncbi:hypothetical protein AB0D57_26430 [Streptomyces sp. NPDC048275]|uniref:hypothetical protein n=1 Tax=Streptomyces sp. NPDC048275 TaxID=3155629 RepID=UPI0033C84339
MTCRTFEDQGTHVVCGKKGKPSFRSAHRRTVDDAHAPHPAATARHPRRSAHQHDLQDRRTT